MLISKVRMPYAAPYAFKRLLLLSLALTLALIAAFMSSSATLSAPALGDAEQPALLETCEPITLYGTVTDRLTGLPLAGAQVVIEDSAGNVYVTTTDSDGEYEFVGSESTPLAPGAASLHVSKAGYVPKSVSLELICGTREQEDIAIEPRLDIAKPYAWLDPICAGHKQRYTLVFTNTTPITLTNVLVVDQLADVCPERCDVCRWNDDPWPWDDCTPGAIYDGARSVSWLLDEIAPGQTLTFYVQIRLWSSVPDKEIIDNCLMVSADQLEPQSACSQALAKRCEEPTPVPPTPTATATPRPTFTPTRTPVAPTATPTAEPTVSTPTPTSGSTIYLPILLKSWIHGMR